MELFDFMADMTKAQRDVIVLEAQCNLESGDYTYREDNACPCNGGLCPSFEGSEILERK
ncbi:MAG: hypothetical protein ACLP9S_10900 [Syntrophales bacterium]